MTSFTKREFFLGGAGLGVGALAGAIFFPTGVNDPWGPGQNQSAGNSFKPKSLCIIYLKFDRLENPPRSGIFVPSFLARHAWFASTGNDRTDQDKAVQKLNEVLGLQPPPGSVPTWPPSEAQRYGEGFKDFNFGGSSRIYIYVDDQQGVTFDEQNLVQFTKYSADHSASGVRRIMKKNKSFSKGSIIEANITGLPGKILYLENKFKKFRDEDWEWMGEDDITNPGYPPSPNPSNPKQPFLEYSMNIHLRMKMANGSSIPLVIDPNTGNGGGWEP